jgi:hypothetical protein
MKPTFHWRKSLSEWGNNLYLGGIFVGNVTRIAPEFTHLPKPWQAWMVPGPDVALVGYYDTEAAAKDALINAVLEALAGEPNAQS